MFLCMISLLLAVFVFWKKGFIRINFFDGRKMVVVTPTPAWGKDVKVVSGRAVSDWVNLSFETGGNNFQERLESAPDSKAKSVLFKGGNVLFEAIETGAKCVGYLDNFGGCEEVSGEVIGDINNPQSLEMLFGIKGFKKVIVKSSGIYQLIQFTSSECSPDVESRLIVKPPKNSGVELIDFWPISLPLRDSDMADICEPKHEVIWEKMKMLELGTDPRFVQEMNAQLNLAKTFSVSK